MKDLRSYLNDLVPNRELITVTQSVTPGEEVASVVKALEPYGAPGVLFESVKGTDWPVLMGTFGVRERINRALGVDGSDCLRHVNNIQTQKLPRPRSVDQGKVQEVIVTDDIDLFKLPFATHSRADAGKYITSGVVLARDPSHGTINTGMYRMMIHDSQTITVNAAPDHDLGRIFASARELDQTVEIAIVIGHHPAYFIASQLKNTVETDSHDLAGALMGGPLEVTKAITSDLPIPANAELVLEGVVSPTDFTQEGPFGEFSYYYGQAKAPDCKITAITHRKDPIFQDLHPTHSEHLCLWLYPGREARLYNRIQQAVPGVVDVRIPFHGGSFSAFISINKRKTGDAKQAILAAFAGDHFLKNVIVVDDDIDVHDTEEMLWASHVRFQADKDLVLLNDAKGIRMDPSADQFITGFGPDTLTSKIGIDATRPIEGFPERADLPHPGFENLNVFEYLDRKTIDSIQQIKNVKEWLRE